MIISGWRKLMWNVTFDIPVSGNQLVHLWIADVFNICLDTYRIYQHRSLSEIAHHYCPYCWKHVNMPEIRWSIPSATHIWKCLTKDLSWSCSLSKHADFFTIIRTVNCSRKTNLCQSDTFKIPKKWMSNAHYFQCQCHFFKAMSKTK